MEVESLATAPPAARIQEPVGPRTLEVLGFEPERIDDVGVAGLHRLVKHTRAIQSANVVIVVAGMEGALASVVGGLTSAPPTWPRASTAGSGRSEIRRLTPAA